MRMRRVLTLTIAAGLAVTGLTTSSTELGGAPAGATRVAQPPGRAKTPAVSAGRQGASQSQQVSAGQPGLPGGSKLVRFGGYTISVPAGWPVYSLAADPSRCVRFDRHAVYLGKPGTSQACPAHLVGRVATVGLTLAGGGTAASTGGIWQPATSGQAGPVSLAPSQLSGGATLSTDQVSGQARATFGSHGLTVTATYGSDAALAGEILRTVRWAGPSAQAAGPVPPTGGTTATRLTADVQAASHHKKKHHKKRPVKGFDTCAAPTTQVMRKWQHAFSAAAIYIGGPEAACGWGNLSRGWVRSATRMGWGLMPTYVGPQAPCTRFTVRIHPGHAKPEGRAAARDAISLARQLGIKRHAPIYYDMEAYNSNRGKCRRAVLSFLNGWTRELHKHHYHSGVYSSAGSAAADLGRNNRVYGNKIAKPNTMWFGLWDGRQNLNGRPYLRKSWWKGQHRIKQYMGGHRRRVHGAKLTIDSDQVYGAVYK
jgi:hypothetical protein